MSKIKLGNRPRYKRLNRRNNKKRENHKFSSANSTSTDESTKLNIFEHKKTAYMM